MSSPLHLVQKKTAEWQPYGDYRPLNAGTVPDNYFLRYIDDFGANLHGKRFFFPFWAWFARSSKSTSHRRIYQKRRSSQLSGYSISCIWRLDSETLHKRSRGSLTKLLETWTWSIPILTTSSSIQRRRRTSSAPENSISTPLWLRISYKRTEVSDCAARNQVFGPSY